MSYTSLAAQSIGSVVFAGSAVVAAGVAGVGASGAGVSAENKIGVDVRAAIDGDGGAKITADQIVLTAEDTSAISAIAVGALLAAAFGAKEGVAVSVGVSLAQNTITSQAEAYLAGADQGVSTTVGDIRITATEDSMIDAVSAAASLSAGLAGVVGISVSGRRKPPT